MIDITVSGFYMEQTLLSFSLGIIAGVLLGSFVTIVTIIIGNNMLLKGQNIVQGGFSGKIDTPDTAGTFFEE